MLQKIVLSNELDGVDYLKSSAILNVDPKNTFGVRYFNTLELAKYLLECSGLIIEEEFISDLSLSAVIYHKTKEIDYFKNYSFSDVYDLVKSLKKLRQCIASNEEVEINKLLLVTSFKRKNEAVIKFYNLLISTLKEDHFIDEIGLIRYAINYAKPIKNAEFVRYFEFEYTNIDIALINVAAGKEVTPTHLFNNDKPRIDSYVKAYGQNSEIEDILAYIYNHNLKFDECLIACSDVSTYAKILSNYEATLNFPIVYNSGQALNDTSVGRLFGYIQKWSESLNHLALLTELINAREFDIEKFKKDIGYLEEDIQEKNHELALSHIDAITFDLVIKTVGDLKLGIDNEELNNIHLTAYQKLVNIRLEKDNNNPIYKRDEIVLGFVNKINDIFLKGIKEFLGSYLLISNDNDSVEISAFDKYIQLINLSEAYDIPLKEVIKLINKGVIGFRKPLEGALYLTSIDKSISYLRKHLFIVGLDSNSFPGKVKEDPIILDQDYELFGIKEASNKKIKDNKILYHDLIALADSLDVKIHLSYASYNSITAKEQNASSVLFETYKKENGDNKTVNDLNNEYKINKDKYREVGFFDVDLFPLSVIGRNIKNDKKIIPNEIVVEENTSNAMSLLSSRGLSATAIEKYDECEYQFFLSTLLHIPQEKETDIYEVIPPNDLGSLAHELMEEFDLTDTKEEFTTKAFNKISEYFISHPSDSVASMAIAVDNFIDMMSNGYDMEIYEKSPSVLKEEDVFTTHIPSGLKIHGFPDKVVRLSDGSYKVIDYKTGNYIRHNVDKKESLIQGALYSYILENGRNKLNLYGNKKIKVTEFVFRYLKNKVNVSSSDKCHNIKEYLEYLDEILLRMAESIKTGKFNKNGDCSSCFYASVCGGVKK